MPRLAQVDLTINRKKVELASLGGFLLDKVVSFDRFKATEAELVQLPRLRRLRSVCEVGLAFLSSPKMPALRELRIPVETYEDFEAIMRTTSITSIDAVGVPLDLRDHSALSMAHLRSASVSTYTIRHIDRFSSAEKLYLDVRDFSSSSFVGLSRIAHLKVLRINFNRIRCGVPEVEKFEGARELCAAPSLRELALYFNDYDAYSQEADPEPKEHLQWVDEVLTPLVLRGVLERLETDLVVRHAVLREWCRADGSARLRVIRARSSACIAPPEVVHAMLSNDRLRFVLAYRNYCKQTYVDECAAYKFAHEDRGLLISRPDDADM